jgi:hypothetical protein
MLSHRRAPVGGRASGEHCATFLLGWVSNCVFKLTIWCCVVGKHHYASDLTYTLEKEVPSSSLNAPQKLALMGFRGSLQGIK